MLWRLHVQRMAGNMSNTLHIGPGALLQLELHMTCSQLTVPSPRLMQLGKQLTRMLFGRDNADAAGTYGYYQNCT